jgi:hypothetical protein
LVGTGLNSVPHHYTDEICTSRVDPTPGRLDRRR